MNSCFELGPSKETEDEEGRLSPSWGSLTAPSYTTSSDSDSSDSPDQEKRSDIYETPKKRRAICVGSWTPVSLKALHTAFSNDYGVFSVPTQAEIRTWQENCSLENIKSFKVKRIQDKCYGIARDLKAAKL